MIIHLYSKDMFDNIALLFEVNPTGPFDSLGFFLGLCTLVLLTSIIFLIVLRIKNPEKDLRNFLNKVPMYYFYFALAGYFLIVFRLSKTPILGARFMWIIWLALAIWTKISLWRQYNAAKKLAARKKANREAGVEVVDPYLAAHYGKKAPQQKKKVTVIKA